MRRFFFRLASSILPGELAQRVLELFHGSVLAFKLLLERGRVAVVLLFSEERLLGKVILAHLHGEHGLLFPVLRLPLVLQHLALELFLISDGHGYLLLGFQKLLVHVHEELVQHLLRVFRLADQRVDVRFEDCAYSVENPHGFLLSGFCAVRGEDAVVLRDRQPDGVQGTLELLQADPICFQCIE